MTLVSEYFIRIQSKYKDRNILLSFSSTTNESFVSEDSKHSSSRIIEKEEEEQASSLCVKVTWYILAVLFTMLTAFCEILEQECAPDGIIAGALLGWWLAFTYEFILRAIVVKHITDLTNRKKPMKMIFLILIALGVFTII